MKILIINPAQFGYSDEYFFYAKYLSENGHDIDYYCLDRNLKKIELNDVTVIYMTSYKSIFNWRIQFYRFVKQIKFDDYNVIVLNHHKLAFIYRMHGVPARTIIDIRTGDLSNNPLKRKFWNLMLKFDTGFYKKITILSESLRKKLKLDTGKCSILKIGADIISNLPKGYYPFRFLYVGTLHKRNIPHTIEGLTLFAEKHPKVDFNYDIIGFGNEQEEFGLIQSIEKSSIRNAITFHGRKNYAELKPYFESANIGFSYVPMTPFFDCQPPTKVFEYILSGLICIATKTTENKKLIAPDNGILCEDNPQSLCNAIEELYNNWKSFDYNKIKTSLLDHQWKRIVDRELEPLFSSMANA